MEIIKWGIDPDNKDYEGTCSHCHTAVKFKKHEAEQHSDQCENS